MENLKQKVSFGEDGIRLIADSVHEIREGEEISGEFVVTAKDLARIIPLISEGLAVKLTGFGIRKPHGYMDYGPEIAQLGTNKAFVMSKDKAVEEINDEVILFRKEVNTVKEASAAVEAMRTAMMNIVRRLPGFVKRMVIGKMELEKFEHYSEKYEKEMEAFNKFADEYHKVNG